MLPEVLEPVDVVVAVVCATALADLSRQRVPNALSFSAMLLGVLYWANEGDVLFALRGIFAFSVSFQAGLSVQFVRAMPS